VLACVCLSLCEYVFVCVLLLVFTDCRIHVFSSLAARLFNKLTRYSLRDCVHDLVRARRRPPPPFVKRSPQRHSRVMREKSPVERSCPISVALR